MNRRQHGDPLAFEREVADLYRRLGAEVEHDTGLAGNQLDVVARERTPSGALVVSAVECKNYSGPVGIDAVNSFSAVVELLRQRQLIQKAVMISSSGFTKPAREAAKAHSLELLEIADLRRRVGAHKPPRRPAPRTPVATKAKAAPRLRRPRPLKRAFIVMPFSPELEDVFMLGIRAAAEQAGLVVERADSIEHTQGILETIHERLRTCQVVIAGTSIHNPDVFYEIGFAHALGKTTVLITKDAAGLPFDLRGINHIVYRSIVDLRDKLTTRLRAVLEKK